MRQKRTKFLSAMLILLFAFQFIGIEPALAAIATDEQTQTEKVVVTDIITEQPIDDAVIIDESADSQKQTDSLKEQKSADTDENLTNDKLLFAPQPLTASVQAELHNGSAVIPQNSDLDSVKTILAQALIVDYDENNDYSSLEWEYFCEGKNTVTGLSKNTAWGSIAGFTSETGKYIKTKYSHPALADNKDGKYQIRIKSTNSEATLTKTSGLASDIICDSLNISLSYKENGSVDYDAVREDIFAQLTTTPNDMTLDDVEITYYATPVTGAIGNLGKKWVALEGEKTLIGDAYTYPAMSAGQQKIKVAYKGGNGYLACEKEFNAAVDNGRAQSEIDLLSNEINLSYNESGTVDYAAVRQAIVDNLRSTPALTINDVTITYYAAPVTGAIGDLGKKWVALEGEKTLIGDAYTYPAMSTGQQKIKVAFGGNNEYLPCENEFNITVANGREAAVLTFAAEPKVKLVYNDDLTLNYDILYQSIYDLIETKVPENLTLADLTITYYATPKTGAIGDLGKQWVSLEGDVINGITYPAISDGMQKVRVSFAGNNEYGPASAQADIEIIDRPPVEFILNAAPYEVGIVFNADQGYNYEATAKAIFDCVISSTTPALDFADITVEYNASQTGLTEQFKPLNSSDPLFKKFADGTWDIRFSYAGNTEYKASSVTVSVTVTDNRIPSVVVLNKGCAITYNMDANIMKQAIYSDMINWESSTLPAKESLSLDNFVIEYNAPHMLTDDILDGTTDWAPIEGSDALIGRYPQMGAGEQQIRITYKGNSEYRPSAAAQETLTVNKANVKVKVRWDNIFAGDPIPANFITTDPADKFDIYTIYAGMTSNVTTSIYLDLPTRYYNETLIRILDPIAQKIYGKSFSQILKDGLTVGELRQLLSNQELLDLLEKLHIDTGTFGQILTAINKLPGIFDNIHVAFGTPMHAGLYNVTAVTDNPNYNTAVGMGTLLVRVHSDGVKLEWNQTISRGKLTASQAKSFDWGVTLTVNGEAVADQSNVSYLYSGFTSKWRPYSSTTTAPTEPGRYAVTVVTLGGDYLAAPITRSFQITK